MATIPTLQLGSNNWATKDSKLLGYYQKQGYYLSREFTFARTSEGTYVGRDGLIKTAPAGIARVDFLGNANGALLLEPARTNLFLNSDVGVTQSITVTDATAYTFYFLEGTGSIALTGAATETITKSDLDLSGAVTFTTSGTTLTCTVTGTANLVQCEEGTYPTSYIKTEGASVNRGSESATIPIGNLISAAQGTIYYEIDVRAMKAGTMRLANWKNTSNSNQLTIYKTSSTLHWYDYANGISRGGTLSYIDNPIQKKAITWDAVGSRAISNGGAISTTDTPFSVEWQNMQLQMEVQDGAYLFREIRLYPDTMTDQELIDLTTL